MIKKRHLFPVIVTGFFMAAVLVYSAPKENLLNSVISSPKIEKKCQTVNTTTFIKSYHFKDENSTNNISLTADGGYILAGWTIINKYMSDSDAFIMKVNSKGKKEWSNLIQSKNNVLSDPLIAKAGEDKGHAVTQLSDGNYILVSETNGFLTDELYGKQEFSGDILISKFDNKGQHIWTETLMGLSLDIPVNIFADNSGGFFLSAAIAKVGYEGADFLHHFVIGKFDSSGKKLWIKKTNLLSWDPLIANTKLNQSFLKDSDGNILLTGMIPIPHESNEYDNGDESEAKANNLSVIVKLDRNGKTIWAKSLEGTSVKLNGVSPRVRAGSFYAIEQTEDKGYLAFGLLSPLITGGTRAKVAKPEYLVAIKLDKDGNYQWAKAVGIGAPLTGFFTAKTKDNGFVFIKNYIAWNNKSDKDNNKADAKLNKILAIKTDKDFNVQWAKKIGDGKEFFGFDVKTTPDQGVVIAGLQRNSTVQDALHGQTFYYDDALLIKLDGNGNTGANCGLISDYSAITAEDISTYISAVNFTPKIENDNELTTNQQNPKILSTDVKMKDLCAIKDYKATICPSKSQTKTWAQTNFDNTKKIDKIAEGKSQEVHEEMLPILERIFTDAKITDNIGAFSLEYVVGRLVTQKDMQDIQKEFEALGYKTYSKDTDQLIMNKIGRMLVIVFSTNDRLRGIITVSF